MIVRRVDDRSQSSLQRKGLMTEVWCFQLQQDTSIRGSDHEEEKIKSEDRDNRWGVEGEFETVFVSIWGASLSFPVLTSMSHQLLLVFCLQLVFCSFQLTWFHPDIVTTHFLSAISSFHLVSTSLFFVSLWITLKFPSLSSLMYFSLSLFGVKASNGVIQFVNNRKRHGKWCFHPSFLFSDLFDPNSHSYLFEP